MDDFLQRLRYEFAITRPTSHVKVTGVDSSPEKVREAIQDLREKSPDEAALLGEYLPLEDFDPQD